MLKITKNSGFHMTFENGWTVSVQFGFGTYSDNKKEDPFSFDTKKSSTAEIAAWNKDDIWYEFDDGDNVRGYVSANDVLDFMNMIANKEK